MYTPEQYHYIATKYYDDKQLRHSKLQDNLPYS